MVQQEMQPMIPAERVRRFAAEESLICLQPPPFRTITEEWTRGGAGDFWERFGALAQLEPDKALIIGDFGLGSDSPIILDYSADPSNPPVLRLRWVTGAPNEWVRGAKDFDEFAEILGLFLMGDSALHKVQSRRWWEFWRGPGV
jgi:hypothetical protein